MKKKRIIFMGTPEIASKYLNFLIKHEHNIIAVYSQPPRKKGRGMKIENSPVHKIALLNNLDIFTPIDFKKNDEINLINKLNPDLIIVMAYGLKLPNMILNIPKYGCINIHVSLLPRWRGAAPIEHALLNGDKRTGITIFKLVEEMDAGPIIISKSIEISKNTNKDQLTEKLNVIGIKLLDSILFNIFSNKAKYIMQTQHNVTYANKISSSIRQLDFYQSSEKLHNKIRAFSVKPAAWFIYKKEIIKVIEAKFVKGDWKTSVILNKSFHVGCKDGKMCPIIIQRQGKKPMELEMFLRGFKFEIDTIINA